MEITEYARTLLTGTSDQTLKKWAYEAQRWVAWHTICLVPLQAELRGDQRSGYLELLGNALADIDERDPLVVPVAVRETLLANCADELGQLVERRTTVQSAA